MFFVRSAEIVPCPCCGKVLYVIGSRRRVWYQSSGARSIMMIRRLRCESCSKIHHELPDKLVPGNIKIQSAWIVGVCLSDHGDNKLRKFSTDRLLQLRYHRPMTFQYAKPIVRYTTVANEVTVSPIFHQVAFST